VDLGGLAGPIGRLAHRKRWQWAMVSTPEVVACFAIVDAGYAASGFAVAADLSSRRVVADVGHFMPREKPHEVVDALLKVLG